MTAQEPNTAERDPPFQRGHVVWVEWLNHAESRPFLILSDESYPSQGEEYLGVPLSTDEQDNAVQIRPEEWETGGLDRPSFALHWRVQTIPHEAIERGIGELSAEAVSEVAQEVTSVLDIR